MTKQELEHTLWVERFRPRSIKDAILTPENRIAFERYLKDGAIPHLLFAGSPGVGKTVAARALCEDLGLEYLFINASLESSVDLLRDKLSGFARSMSLEGDTRKAIILDEADGVTSQAFFPAMRPMLEQFAANCTFIFTCNYIEKIPVPIKSRLQTYKFEIPDRKWYAGEMLKRCDHILTTEGVEYDKGIIAKIILKFFPDFRQVINAMQQHRDYLKDPKLEYRLTGLDLSQLFDALKQGDFAKIREFVANDIQVLDSIYTQIYQAMKDYIDSKDIGTALMILSDFNRDHQMSIDKEIHVMGFLLQLKKNVSFK